MNFYKKLTAILLFFMTSLIVIGSESVDCVIFSYNRPMQLYAFLESVEKYVTGIGKACVIYRADNEQYAQGYQEVAKKFPSYDFLRQGDRPREDFKPLTLESSFNNSQALYIVYGVDDIVVKDYVDLTECADLLEKHNAYAFYLRLGKNLTECYSLRQSQPLPPLQEVESNVFTWRFNQGSGDWAYPHSVDMTVIRKSDIIEDFTQMFYYSPNTLEGQWASRDRIVKHKIGLCYGISKIVNFPLNLVQNDWSNRHMTEYTPEQLMIIFDEGKKIDIAPVHQMCNAGAHTEYSPTFIQR